MKGPIAVRIRYHVRLHVIHMSVSDGGIGEACCHVVIVVQEGERVASTSSILIQIQIHGSHGR